MRPFDRTKIQIPLTFMIALAMLGMGVGINPAQAADYQSQNVVVNGFHNVYAPFTFRHQNWGTYIMYSGGWKTPDDENNDTEKLFYCYVNAAGDCYGNTVWPIRWVNHSESGSIPGYHINDPTVLHPYALQHANQQWVYMYYTALPDAAASTSVCGDLIMNNEQYDPPQAGCIGVSDTTVGIDAKQHKLGFASGTDGANFYDHGPIMSHANGVWSPSALKAGEELWVYYHDAVEVKIHRQKINLDGWNLIGNPELVTTAGYDDGLVNVDVQKVGANSYVLLANPIGDTQVIRMVSSDGLSFAKSSQDSSVVLINGSTSRRYSGPHTEKVSGNSYRVYSGYDTSGTNARSNSIRARLYLDQ